MHAHPSGTCLDQNPSATDAPTIIIFEQDEYLASLLHFLLSREGFIIHAITDPDQAECFVRGNRPVDLLFIDDCWLKDDDPKILEVIRNHEDWQKVPIIGLMRYFRSEDVGNALDKGINDYILQPFDVNELLDRIQQHLKFDNN